MNIAEDSQIIRLRSSLVEGMRAYMQDGEVAYDESHIAVCEAILTKYLEAIGSATDRTSSLSLVKDAVLAFNELNEQSGCELIETGQREDICAILIRAGALRGFNSADEDVTEEWREW